MIMQCCFDRGLGTLAPPLGSITVDGHQKDPEIAYQVSAAIHFFCKGLLQHWQPHHHPPTAISTSASSSNLKRKTFTPNRECECKKGICKIYVSGKERSKGKRFYRCPKGRSIDDRGFFAWLNDDNHTTVDLKYQLIAIHEAIEQNLNGMKKALDIVEKKIELVDEKLDSLEKKIIKFVAFMRIITFLFIVCCVYYLILMLTCI